MDIEQARQLAKGETTAPEVLAQLATNEDRETRRSVAENPNTPTGILLKLGAEFPEELLNNPIFDLLLLEKPNLIEDIPIKTLRNLIKQDNVPESFIIECAERESDEDLLLAMTVNPTISRSVLEKLHQSKFGEVSEAARLHINWSGEITEGWREFAKNKIIDLSSVYGGTECHYDLTCMISAKLLPQDFLDYFGNTKEGKHVLEPIQITKRKLNNIKKITEIDEPFKEKHKQSKIFVVNKNIDREYVKSLIFDLNTPMEIL